MASKSDNFEAVAAAAEADALTAINTFISEANNGILHALEWKCVCGHRQSLEPARKQRFSEIAARNWLQGVMKNHCKGGGHIQAKRRAELAKLSSLHRFIGSGTASSGASGAAASRHPQAAAPQAVARQPEEATTPSTSSGDLEAQVEPTASHPTTELAQEPQQGAVLEPLLSASVEIAGALRLVTLALL
jgi:hypothetical protein